MWLEILFILIVGIIVIIIVVWIAAAINAANSDPESKPTASGDVFLKYHKDMLKHDDMPRSQVINLFSEYYIPKDEERSQGDRLCVEE